MQQQEVGGGEAAAQSELSSHSAGEPLKYICGSLHKSGYI
jgi:hypothetical protein